MHRSTLALSVLVAASTLVLAACGGTAATPTPSAQQVSVALTEWSVTPSVATAKAGKVNFTATNRGQLPHELVVFKTDVAAGSIPVKDGLADEAAGTVIGEIEPEELGPGKSDSHTWDLAAGKYVLLCNIAGHYQAGMAVAFTVE